MALSTLALVFCAPVAQAAEPGSESNPLQTALASGDEEKVIEALRAVAKAPEPAFVPPVKRLIEHGGSEKLLVQAFKTAGKLGHADLSQAIAPYVAHRLEGLRRGATRALVATKGPHAVVALRAALRSPDAMVRGTAASGLGGLGDRSALDDLFTALEHNVGEAAASIGQLCDPAACQRLLDRVGKSPLDIITSGVDQILFRPQSEISEDDKVKIVGRLRELGTKEAMRYLKDVLDRWPKDASARVRQALKSAVQSAAGGA
jgi:hypothetical protein